MTLAMRALVVLLLLAPAVAAAGAPDPAKPPAPPQAPSAQEAPLPEAVPARETLARIVGAAADGVAAAARGLGHAAAWTASLVASAALAATQAVAAALGAAADGLVAGARALGAGLVAVATGLADAIGGTLAALASLLARGAGRAAAHPRESAAVAGGAAGLGALAWALRRLGVLGALPLYSRLTRAQVLDHDVRARLYARIRAQPGVHASLLAEEAGIGWGTVVHHLAKLEEAGLVASKTVHGRRCLFATGTAVPADRRLALGALAGSKAREIAEVVRRAPGISQKELAARLGMSEALASWHVKRLVAARVLRARREGRVNALRLVDDQPVEASPAPAVAVA